MYDPILENKYYSMKMYIHKPHKYVDFHMCGAYTGFTKTEFSANPETQISQEHSFCPVW